MTKYLLNRLLRGVLSIIAVVAIVMILVYTFMDRELIFASDGQYQRKSGNQQVMYKYNKWEKYGYLDYVTYTDYLKSQYQSGAITDLATVSEANQFETSSTLTGANATAKKYMSEFEEYYTSKGYTIYKNGYEKKQNGILFAYKDISVFVRLIKYFGQIISIDNIHYVEDNFTDDTTYEPVELENKGIYFTLFDPVYNTEKGGYYIGFESNGTKYYLNASRDKSGVTSVTYTTTASQLFYWDNINYCYETEIDDDLYYLGYNSNDKELKPYLVSDLSEAKDYTKYIFTVVAKDGDTYKFMDTAGEGTIAGFYEYGVRSLSSYAKFENGKITTSDTENTLVQDYKEGGTVVKKVFSPCIYGIGTKNKYLLYFDSSFPFIHQNLISINLGVSYAVNKDVDIFNTMFDPQDPPITSIETYPSGYVSKSSSDFHTASYSYGSRDSYELNKLLFTDDYTVVTSHEQSMSKTGFSFVIGIISTIISYVVGIPIGIWMARKKDKLVDKIGTIYIILIIAVPSLAYIFLLRSLALDIRDANNNLIFPIEFDLQSQSVGMYVLPIISLSLPSIGGFMKWIRRYMIDQMNSDYVKFARSGGMSEPQIFTKHILKNAIIPIVHGIPGSILGAVTGAIITESIYKVPGAGGLFTKALGVYDNSVIVGLTLFYACLSVISLVLGDILMSIVDPRISFTDKAR